MKDTRRAAGIFSALGIKLVIPICGVIGAGVKLPTLAFAAILILSSTASFAAFNIDFRNGSWAADGSSTAATGWPKVGLTSTPQSAGTQDLGGGLSVRVQSSFVGGATKGTENLTLNAPQTYGFAFQDNGANDRNPDTGVITKYQRVDFTFSSLVRLDSLNIEDIDRNNATGSAFSDAVSIQLWTSLPTAFGDGINPDISFNPVTNLTRSARGGADFVYASLGGNTTTTTTGSDVQTNDPRSIANFSSNESIKGFSMFLWNFNDSTRTGSKHGVVIKASGSEITAIPEPAAFALLGGLGVFILMVSRRRR